MAWRFPARAPACEVDECGAPAWRWCRVCEIYICAGHRYGSGLWFRCLTCPADVLAKLRREDEKRRDALRAHERRLMARAPPAVLRCRSCGAVMSARLSKAWPDVTLWTPSCHCRP